MGTRYFLTVTCPNCGHTDDDVYYAPTCDFTTHECKCGHVVDLEELTGISAEDASNASEISDLISALSEERGGMNDQQLAAIEAREERATEGPWTSVATWLATGDRAPLVSGPVINMDDPVRIADCDTTWRSRDDCMANAEFIAHARADIPALVAEVRRLRAQLRKGPIVHDVAEFYQDEVEQ